MPEAPYARKIERSNSDVKPIDDPRLPNMPDYVDEELEDDIKKIPSRHFIDGLMPIEAQSFDF